MRVGLMGVAVLALSGCFLSWDYKEAPTEAANAGGAGQEGGSGGLDSNAGGSGLGTSTGPTGSTVGSGIDPPGCASCVGAAPPGWEGYFRMVTTANGRAPTDCGDGSPPEAVFSGAPGGASCGACSCGPAGGATCTAPLVECYYNSSYCSGSSMQIGGAGCSFVGPYWRSCRITIPSTLANQSSCEPSGGGMAPLQGWQTVHSLCPIDVPGEGCDAEQICTDQAAGAICIKRQGAYATCPSGWESITPAFSSATDTRSCTSCTCGASTGASCSGGSYSVHASQGYGTCNLVESGYVTTACKALPTGSNELEYVAGTATQGSACPASGGEPTGSFAPEDPVTICCRSD